MTTNEKIIALVKPEYLKKIPKIFRKHATDNTCKLIAREHSELYKAFEDGEPTDSQKQEMTDLVNVRLFLLGQKNTDDLHNRYENADDLFSEGHRCFFALAKRA